MCEHVALGIKLSGFASLGYNVQSHLGAFPGFDFGQIESYLLLSLRSHIHGKVAVGSRLSIREKLPLKGVLREVGEEVFVIHFDYAFCKVDGAEMHVLVSLLHLRDLRRRTAVGQYKAVDAEVLVVLQVSCAEVAAIGIIRLAILVFGEDTLIYPVPDAATLQSAVLAD